METTRITKTFAKKIYKPAANDAHKGNRGHVLLIGGSYGKIGSVTLSAKAALHAGSGLVTAFVPECGYSILQTAIPEVMVLTDTESRHLSHIAFEFQPDAIGIGPGIGQEQAVANAFHEFLQTVKTPLVIDADGLNLLSANPEWLSLLPENSILTPHPGELSRLIGSSETREKAVASAKKFASEHKIIFVLKGAPTFVTNGASVFENTTGNPALATAGSGDVLTGIITSLLGQGYDPLEAAQLGVYLHGLTADAALPEKGVESFIASDIISGLGKAYLTLSAKKRK